MFLAPVGAALVSCRSVPGRSVRFITFHLQLGCQVWYPCLSMNEAPSPEAFGRILGDLLADIEKARAHLTSRMASEASDDDKLAIHVRLAKELAVAAVDVSKEARAWAKQAKEIGAKLTLQERMDLTVAFIRKLTPVDRAELLDRCRG